MHLKVDDGGPHAAVVSMEVIETSILQLRRSFEFTDCLLVWLAPLMQ